MCMGNMDGMAYVSVCEHVWRMRPCVSMFVTVSVCAHAFTLRIYPVGADKEQKMVTVSRAAYQKHPPGALVLGHM